MATINLVVGSNTYLDLATAEETIPPLLGSTGWASLTDEEKKQVLVTASGLLDQRFSPLPSVAVSSTQTMGFPRKEFSYVDRVLGLRVTVPQGTYPAILQKACSFLAAHLANHHETLFGDSGSSDWSSVSLSGLSISRDTTQDKRFEDLADHLIPGEVTDLMSVMNGKGGSKVNTWWRAN